MEMNESLISLFSLEVAVESMRIHSSSIPCRFPAVAFRLLDFPTLIVNHIESVDADKIKDSVFIDQEINGIPAQLQELKDHRGNFVLKKGKSCMFKMNIESLQMHLNTTPLYVMVVDTWPSVPKLVANCTVSLEEVIKNICADIQKCGIEVPAVHSVWGSYKLSNLMGHEIGWVVLGLRLLSLGSSLMAHIPQSSLVMRKSVENKQENISPKKVAPTSNLTQEDSLPNYEVGNLDEDAENRKTKLMCASSITQPRVETSGHIPSKHSHDSGTQTIKTRNTRTNINKSVLNPSMYENHVQESDLIITNTHCPPPLYFNADLHVNDESGLQHPNVLQTEHVEENDIRNASVTSSETMSICSMEQYTETHYKFQSVASGEEQSTMSVRKNRKQSGRQIKSSPKTPRTLNTEEFSQAQESIPTLNLANHHEMPILRALLQELSLLHGNVLPAVPPVRSGSQQKGELHHTPRVKENVPKEQDILISQQQSPYRHKHEDCVRTPRGVPSGKSWLRKEPKKMPIKKKTKLHFGMTNTQKLRLQKNNPELLKQIQAQEHTIQTYRERIADKVQKKKQVKGGLQRKARPNSYISSENDNHVEDSVHHIRDPKSNTSGEKKEAHMESSVNTASNVSLRIDVQDVSTDLDEQAQAKRRKPVPTPRTAKGATFKWSDMDRTQQSIECSQSEATEKDGNDPQVKGVYSSSEKSVKSGLSIDVYLPTPTMEDSFMDADQTQSSISTPVNTPQKTITVPGFVSAETTGHDEDTDRKTSLRYSDDFDSSKNFETTGEEQELRHLSKSSSDESDQSAADSHNDDSSGESNAKQSSTSYHSKMSDVPQRIQQNSGISKTLGTRHQLPARLHPGLAMPQPLLSTRSPVPLAGKRQSSRPSIQVQPSIDSQDDNEVAQDAPPTPKPRINFQQTGSTLSTASRPLDNLSSSEFGTNYSGKEDVTGSEKDKSDDNYSEEFDSSDSSY